jgi:hypothetical protein
MGVKVDRIVARCGYFCLVTEFGKISIVVDNFGVDLVHRHEANVAVIRCPRSHHVGMRKASNFVVKIVVSPYEMSDEMSDVV